MIRQPKSVEKATPEGFPLYLLTGLGIGLIVGILAAWLLFPARPSGISPDQFSKLEKEEYRTQIAMAYAANGDAQRAAARLNLLGDLDPIRELNIQAQLALLSQDSQREARALSQLSQAIYAIVLERIGDGSGVQVELSGDAQYLLSEQQVLCNGPDAVPVLGIYLLGADGNPNSGLALGLSSEAGTEEAISGELAEQGAGYAQFDLFPQSVFALSIEEIETLLGLQTPSCSEDNGASYWGSLLITLRAIP